MLHRLLPDTWGREEVLFDLIVNSFWHGWWFRNRNLIKAVYAIMRRKPGVNRVIGHHQFLTLGNRWILPKVTLLLRYKLLELGRARPPIFVAFIEVVFLDVVELAKFSDWLHPGFLLLQLGLITVDTNHWLLCAEVVRGTARGAVSMLEWRTSAVLVFAKVFV